MDERKRDVAAVVSPQKKEKEKEEKKKKRKNLDKKENTDINTKPQLARIKYSFAPVNNLASSTPLKSIKIDNNLPKSGNQKEISTPFKLPPSAITGSDTPSSDDHVFWALTPTPKSKIERDMSKSNEKSKLSSSPLAEPLNITINPIQNLPEKYPTINFSSQQSPEVIRTLQNPLISESFPQSRSKKKNLLFKGKNYFKFSQFNTPEPSSLKTKDLAGLINTLESQLTSKNNIFNNTESDLKLETEIPSNLTHVNITKPATLQSALKTETENSSDFFDDSEDFLNDLDKVLDKRTQPVLKEELLTRNQTESFNGLNTIAHKLNQSFIDIKDEKRTDKTDTDEDMDSTSDFDDDLINEILLKKSTQPRDNSQLAVTTLQPSLKSEPLLTTQEKNVQKADLAGQMIFKKNIEETDTKKVTPFRKPGVNVAKAAVERDGIRRFQVLKSIKSTYPQGSQKKEQKILSVVDGYHKQEKIVLRDLWARLEIEDGDIIHVIGSDYKRLDSETDTLLIWNPDILLSATLIGDTINCQRRSVLKTRLDFRGESSIALIVGEIVHSVFQSVLRESNPSLEYMRECLEYELDDYIVTILTIDETKDTIRGEVLTHVPYIKTWYELYVRPTPSPKSMVRVPTKSKQTKFAASNILDIEENIWSPIYGLRGLIDVTIEATLQKEDGNEGKFIAPLELKSGKSMYVAHQAQASLYTLLMKDRYDLDVEFFMLTYTRLKETSKNEINKRQLKDLIYARNSLSNYLKEGVRFLPKLMQSSVCDNCFVINECMTYNKLMEDGTAEESGLVEGNYDRITGHLDNPKYQEFFNYWDGLITKEEGTINLLKRDLFLIDSVTREKTTGKCLSRLIIKAAKDEESSSSKFVYIFERNQTGFGPLNGSQLAKHDKVLVSDESGHYALCSGWVLNVRPDFITISTDRRLKNNNLKMNGFSSQNNQTYQSLLKPLDPTQKVNNSIMYRIDKDEMFHGMRMARSNLMNLFLEDGDTTRREFIVDGRKPTFNDKPLPYKLDKNHTFNIDQIQAFDKVLSANDYALLLGMPGTGKTTVIAQLIRFLVENGKTVLLTSYTHSAVDNILLKLTNDDINILRLGSVSRIHPEAHQYVPLKNDIKTAHDLKERFLHPPVVATTCLGINDWIFNKRKFDYCIVDESSQVSMPVCIGPLSFCDKFILVGDHFQLPPLVQNPDAKGLSKSLFKILSDSSPEAVVELTHQYRMCSDIMLLSNTIIYNGRLKYGSETVANQFLKIANIKRLALTHTHELNPQNAWIETVLNERNKVLFLNHDQVGGCNENSVKERVENVKEAELVRQIVEAMLLCGVSEKSIGVMSLYRAQLRLFYSIFSERKEVEMLTADQFQGRDKDVVIISLVKSNDKNDAGSLIKEWRRLNVAITRARSKLIIIGSRKTLQNLNTIDAFMNILTSRGWFYDLPPGADTFYNIESAKPKEIRKMKSPKAQKSVKCSKIFEKTHVTRDILREMGL